jgi:hypothetical protein
MEAEKTQTPYAGMGVDSNDKATQSDVDLTYQRFARNPTTEYNPVAGSTDAAEPSKVGPTLLPAGLAAHFFPFSLPNLAHAHFTCMICTG